MSYNMHVWLFLQSFVYFSLLKECVAGCVLLNKSQGSHLGTVETLLVKEEPEVWESFGSALLYCQ